MVWLFSYMHTQGFGKWGIVCIILRCSYKRTCCIVLSHIFTVKVLFKYCDTVRLICPHSFEVYAQPLRWVWWVCFACAFCSGLSLYPTCEENYRYFCFWKTWQWKVLHRRFVSTDPKVIHFMKHLTCALSYLTLLNTR